MPNVTNRYARKPATTKEKIDKVLVRAALSESAAAAEDESLDASRKAIFTANLPCFRAVVRGNVVADGETFTSKNNVDYYTFRIAYTRMRHGDKSTMFIKVIAPVGLDILKGNYVEVSGDYSDDGVSPGLNGYGPSVFRTIFVGPDDSVKVLIG